MIRSRGCFGVAFVSLCLCLIVCGSAKGQTPGNSSTLRLKGIIDRNQTWSGHVFLTGDVEIDGAVVTIAPGTIIEFARATADRSPVLIVGSARRAGGELVINATADAPVTFRAKPNETPGRIVVNIRNKILPGKVNENPFEGVEPSTIEPNDVTWHNVRFVGLGKARRRGGETKTTTVFESALTFNVVGGPHTFRLTDCVFEDCTRVSIRGGDRAKLSIEANRFSGSEDRVSLEVQGDLSGDPVEYIYAKGNSADSAIVFSGSATTAAENVLIGEYASLVIDRDVKSPTRVVGNYIHNTAQQDDGRYCLDCRVSDAEIERNVFRGATTIVLNGSREMRENVFIGVMLESEVVKNARTHHHVRTLPVGAIFERNLLLGPAYSMLAPQAGMTQAVDAKQEGPTVVRHNLFDGFDEGRRAIHLNPLGVKGGKVAIYNNVFLRAATLVYDELRSGDVLLYLDHNAAAPKPTQAYEGVKIGAIALGSPGFAAADVFVGSLAALRLRDVPRRVPEDIDREIRSGKIQVEHWRKSLFAAYAPQAESPLVGAGHPIQGEQAARPTIGPRDPSR